MAEAAETERECVGGPVDGLRVSVHPEAECVRFPCGVGSIDYVVCDDGKLRMDGSCFVVGGVLWTLGMGDA